MRSGTTSSQKSWNSGAPDIDASSDTAEEQLIEDVRNLCKLNDLASRDEAATLLPRVAAKNEYNPIIEHLGALKWDGTPRFEHVAATLQSDDAEVASFGVRCFLLQACAAADYGMLGMQANPSMRRQFGYVLVLVGLQGRQKTTWFHNVLPEPLRGYFKTGVNLDPTNRDSVKAAVSGWIVELGELDGVIRKSDVAHLKAFLTRDRDEMRMPYARSWSSYPRRSTYVGTVNEEEFLRDVTGNRRFVPVRVGAVDSSFSGIDIEQVWAEAWHRYCAGEEWWPAEVMEARLRAHTERFRARGMWEELLAQCYAFEHTTRVGPRKTVVKIYQELREFHGSTTLSPVLSPQEQRALSQAIKTVNRLPETGDKVNISGKMHPLYVGNGKAYGWLMPPMRGKNQGPETACE